jgi:hypothetical protein
MSRVGVSFWGPLRRSVVQVRGQQIAEHMGAELNPTSGYEEDVNVFITYCPRIPIPRKAVMDPNDHKNQWEFISEHPELQVIAISRPEQAMFRKIFHREIHYIPDHHANYARERRPARPVMTVGTVGSRASLHLDLVDLDRRLRDIGITMQRRDMGRRREHVLQAYRTMDVQIVFRANLPDREICDALKLSNAGSFGIPTVAYPEVSYAAEYDGCFIPAHTIEELVEGVHRLSSSPSLYQEYSDKALARSEDYHIDAIVQRYLSLRELW